MIRSSDLPLSCVVFNSCRVTLEYITNQVALITGGGTGIGFAIACELMSLGNYLVLSTCCWYVTVLVFSVTFFYLSSNYSVP